MDVKSLNRIFGYSLYGIGAAKAILFIIILMTVGTNFNLIKDGGNVDLSLYQMFARVIAIIQLIVAIGSFVMIVLNIKVQPKTIIWYIWALIALGLEIILPSLIMVFFIFAEIGMYMNAGRKILKADGMEVGSSNKDVKKTLESTAWFYEDDK